ncbi:tetratricopeptide repeat protein [Uliginosibacterium sp. 31-12]|uniref:tetratricopeptide repeat protein n=1 Tax=Uliginosibacterium sp. 31-12 TaxID=3062781 RepID=UPI0026E3E728|nr:tetratricopeptide repeat protein [Uliginosibacterium sp. 31-12]MDO6384871.1 tetratricopeptide repeat protein [Uliginosibacterium sp. 31-12]
MSRADLLAAVQAEERGDLEAAVAAYANILEQQPDCVEALSNLGAICVRAGQPEEALNFYTQALSHQPGFRPARMNLARTLAQLGRTEEADMHYRQALAQEASPALQVERLQQLVAAGRLQQARAEAETACASSPEEAGLWQVAGNARLYLNQPEAAEAAYRRALEIDDSARARANLAMALLAQGRFAEAWPYYEARHDSSLLAHDAVRFTDYPWPRWQGEALAGKRILLMGEQGLGDQIQFARFIEPLAASGAHVDLVCRAGLRGLLGTAPGLQACHAEAPMAEHFDYWSPLLSLPLHLDDKNPLRTWQYPYLQAAPEKRQHWRKQLAEWAGQKKKIGIAWRGAAGNASNRMRSITTEEILELPRRLGAQAMFFSLQKDDASSGELDQLCSGGIIPLGDMQQDFSDTAALACELDLIIAVDTSVAHAVGALGCPVHILLAPGLEWRWGKPGSPSCALYPSARLHWKDSAEGSWKPLLSQLCEELSQSWAQNSSA